MKAGVQKLHVLVTLEQGELIAQCLELDITARALSFGALRRSFELSVMGKLIQSKLTQGSTDPASPTERINIPKAFAEQYRKAKPMADLIRIQGKYVVEFAVL
jgi:hypothetical protein